MPGFLMIFANDTAESDFLQSESPIFLAQNPVPEYIEEKKYPDPEAFPADGR